MKNLRREIEQKDLRNYGNYAMTTRI